LDLINCDRLNGVHAELVVVIPQTHGAKLNPPLSPLRAGLPCLSHLTDELGAGKGEIGLAQSGLSEFVPALKEESQAEFCPLHSCSSQEHKWGWSL
jgi:hypothetical protein